MSKNSNISIRNKKNSGRKELKEASNNWSNILLGNQFLNMYFYKLGISNSLVVDRIVKMEDFKTKKNSEKLQFAIVRSTYNPNNIKYDKNNNQIYNHSRADYKSYEKTFLENNMLFFVSLFFLGFFN
jgi:hypothetical protein